jgi:hypothetical protein
MPQPPDCSARCGLQEAMLPRLDQYLLEAGQEEGTCVELQDMSPANIVREGMMAHLDRGSMPKGAKYAGPLGGPAGHMLGMA